MCIPHAAHVKIRTSDEFITCLYKYSAVIIFVDIYTSTDYSQRKLIAMSWFYAVFPGEGKVAGQG
ncbi:MAG: hypothetical protein R2759_19495 [Bacteroidales bacterium]